MGWGSAGGSRNYPPADSCCRPASPPGACCTFCPAEHRPLMSSRLSPLRIITRYECFRRPASVYPSCSLLISMPSMSEPGGRPRRSAGGVGQGACGGGGRRGYGSGATAVTHKRWVQREREYERGAAECPDLSTRIRITPKAANPK
eukprot:scaffold15169_cov53-Isochrysis_galbana.AAC.1